MYHTVYFFFNVLGVGAPYSLFFLSLPSPSTSSRLILPLKKQNVSRMVQVSKLEKNQACPGSRRIETVRDDLTGLFDFAWRFSYVVCQKFSGETSHTALNERRDQCIRAAFMTHAVDK
jgi:hypothetical protein